MRMPIRVLSAANSGGAREWAARCAAGLLYLLLGGLALDAGAQESPGSAEKLLQLASGKTYVVYGDILVPVDAATGVRGAHAGARWPAATLYYTFHSSVSEARRALFRQWATHWESGSGLRLSESASAANRVLVQVATGIGCGQSAVGMQGGVQDLVIDCWNESSTTLHELGHALGMIHEQQRADRASYISVQDQGVERYCGEGTWIANFGIEGSVERSAYDFASIMHYASFDDGDGPGYNCGGEWVGANINVLQPQPSGPPAGSENVCTTVAQCQALLGQAAYPSPRDGYSAALRYGYRIAVTVSGDGSGSVAGSGERESCGSGCYLVTPQSLFTLTATPAAGSVARFSGACSGQSCQFPVADNGEVRVRFIRKSTLMTMATVASGLIGDRLFVDGFQSR